MERTPAIRTWHICISGFTQREGELTGLLRLWRELNGRHAGPECCVSLRTWKANFSDLAELIWIISQEQECKPKVAVYAYSWGGGRGFVQLSRELRKRGIMVEAAVLCDPVYYSPWFSFRWLAMTSWRKVAVPENVKCVRWFYQRQDRPRSPGVVADDPQLTYICDGQELIRTHHFMDEAGEFHKAARAVAEAL